MRRRGRSRTLAALLDEEAGFVDPAAFTQTMKHILLASCAGVVVAQEYSLCAIAPAQQRRECAGLRLACLADQGRELFRQAIHHENECVQCMNAVRAQPGPGSVRWRL